MHSSGLSSVAGAKPTGAKLKAAPVSIKIPQAALFLRSTPKMLLLLLCIGDLKAGKLVVVA